MKSRLQTSIAELYKLKNQIRVQLNQIRPNKPILIQEKHDKSAKKQFSHRCNQSTSIVNPSEEQSKVVKLQSKKLFNQSTILHSQLSKSKEKKHYIRHYDASVGLENTIKRKTCSYFNVKQERSPLTAHCHNTSLSGIGMNDRQQSKSSKRINPKKYMCTGDLI